MTSILGLARRAANTLIGVYEGAPGGGTQRMKDEGVSRGFEERGYTAPGRRDWRLAR
jgi:hypothetical protein